MVDIGELSDDELKALAYDQLVLLRTVQQNIRLIENELARRAPATTEEG